MDDASNLDYQAGQDDDQGGDEQQDGDKKKPEAEKPEKEQNAAEGEQDAEAEEEGPEGDDQDGGVNEDTADKHEDRQFAQPEVNIPHTIELKTVSTWELECNYNNFRGDFTAQYSTVVIIVWEL